MIEQLNIEQRFLKSDRNSEFVDQYSSILSPIFFEQSEIQSLNRKSSNRKSRQIVQS